MATALACVLLASTLLPAQGPEATPYVFVGGTSETAIKEAEIFSNTRERAPATGEPVMIPKDSIEVALTGGWKLLVDREFSGRDVTLLLESLVARLDTQSGENGYSILNLEQSEVDAISSGILGGRRFPGTLEVGDPVAFQALSSLVLPNGRELPATQLSGPDFYTQFDAAAERMKERLTRQKDQGVNHTDVYRSVASHSSSRYRNAAHIFTAGVRLTLEQSATITQLGYKEALAVQRAEADKHKAMLTPIFAALLRAEDEWVKAFPSGTGVTMDQLPAEVRARVERQLRENPSAFGFADQAALEDFFRQGATFTFRRGVAISTNGALSGSLQPVMSTARFQVD